MLSALVLSSFQGTIVGASELMATSKDSSTQTMSDMQEDGTNEETGTSSGPNESSENSSIPDSSITESTSQSDIQTPQTSDEDTEEIPTIPESTTEKPVTNDGHKDVSEDIIAHEWA
mgnify:CR=1 FL=1